MTMEQSIGAPSRAATDWQLIDWAKVRRDVRRLQLRIAKAIRAGKHGRVKALQWLLTHSQSAKQLAVKRVTENKGAKTPGVDNVIWRTDKQKYRATQNLKRRGYRPQPLRRHYIPKKNGKMRPLSIPVMRDRAMQALHALGLMPIARDAGRPKLLWVSGRPLVRRRYWPGLLCTGQKLRAGLGAGRRHQSLLRPDQPPVAPQKHSDG